MRLVTLFASDKTVFRVIYNGNPQSQVISYHSLPGNLLTYFEISILTCTWDLSCSDRFHYPRRVFCDVEKYVFMSRRTNYSAVAINADKIKFPLDEIIKYRA